VDGEEVIITEKSPYNQPAVSSQPAFGARYVTPKGEDIVANWNNRKNSTPPKGRLAAIAKAAAKAQGSKGKNAQNRKKDDQMAEPK
jgi:hypothetical protein